jgi:hypothetical protein
MNGEYNQSSLDLYMVCTMEFVEEDKRFFRSCSVNPIQNKLKWIERNFNLYRIYSSSIHFNPVGFPCNPTYPYLACSHMGRRI